MHLIEQAYDIKKAIESNGLVVALFSDLACNVCLAITPDLITLSQKYPKALFVTSDVEATKALVGDYLIFAYPTVIVFAQGKETKRFERVFAMGHIEETVQRYYDLLFDA